MAEEHIKDGAEQEGTTNNREAVVAENEAAEVDGLIGEGSNKTDGIVTPCDAGGGSEDKPKTQRQHDHRELRLSDDPPDNECIDQEAEGGGYRDCTQGRNPVIEAEPCNKAERGETAQHHNVTLSEIDELGCLVNQHKAECDQPIDAAARSAINNKLKQAERVPHGW